MNSAKFHRLFGWRKIWRNSYASVRDAREIRRIVMANPRYNNVTRFGPRKCRCTRARRCRIGVDCENRLEWFECNTCHPNCDNKKLQEFSSRFNAAKVYISYAAGMGLGLKATELIGQGEIIGEYIGQYVTYPEGKLDIESYYSYTVGQDEPNQRRCAIDSFKEGNEMRYANHSCEENAEVFQVMVGNENRMGIRAKRVILPNEVVTINYGAQYFEGGLVCRCTPCQEGRGLAAARRAAEAAAAAAAARRNGGRRGPRRRRN